MKIVLGFIVAPKIQQGKWTYYMQTKYIARKIQLIMDKELIIILFGIFEPMSKILKSSGISSMVVLCEMQQIGPSEIRVFPLPFWSGNKILWGSHHFLFFRAQEESQWHPLLVFVQYCPMQATFVYSIW